MAGFIPDGYSRDDGYVAAAPKEASGEVLWDALSFSYRVASRSEVSRHDAECRIALKNEDNDAGCAVEVERLASKFVASRLTKWDLKDPSGNPVPITAENVARMQTVLFARVYRIVRGISASEKKPEATEETQSDADAAKN